MKTFLVAAALFTAGLTSAQASQYTDYSSARVVSSSGCCVTYCAPVYRTVCKRVPCYDHCGRITGYRTIRQKVFCHYKTFTRCH